MAAHRQPKKTRNLNESVDFNPLPTALDGTNPLNGIKNQPDLPMVLKISQSGDIQTSKGSAILRTDPKGSNIPR